MTGEDEAFSATMTSRAGMMISVSEQRIGSLDGRYRPRRTIWLAASSSDEVAAIAGTDNDCFTADVVVSSGDLILHGEGGETGTFSMGGGGTTSLSSGDVAHRTLEDDLGYL